MKVLSITFKERVVKKLPYVLTDGRKRVVIYTVFNVEIGPYSCKKELWLDLEYQPEKALKGILADALKRKFGDTCENIDKAYQMFWKELPNRPYDSESATIQFR